jgi:prepilin-type N-terminal cleavage/methylation domain-containing protein
VRNISSFINVLKKRRRKIMKKGFTLLELIVVIIILGVLATLGLGQYGRMIEKSRAAEAKVILGSMRKLATGYYLEFSNLGGLSNTKMAMGTTIDLVPTTCRASHYFSYGFTTSASAVTSTATRCTGGGKTPQGTTSGTLVLTSAMTTGVDTWSGSGGY